ncbi:MAG: efflux RND transporter periplasmic adaptor subunit [Pseudomonadota bacterium]
MGKNWFIAALLLVLGAAAGMMLDRYGFVPVMRDGGKVPPAASALPERAANLPQTVYVCPMHPEIVKPEPGTCPICGMRLVAVASETAPSSAPPSAAMDISIPPTVTNSLSVRTVRIKRETLWRQAKLSAYVQGYTPGGAQTLHAPAAGRITALHPGPAGVRVRKGDLLFEIEAAGRNEKPERHKFNAQMDGHITAIDAHVGDAVEINAPLFSVQTVGETAVDVDIFRSQLLWMKSGDRAELRLSHMPERVWRGTVAMEGAQLNLQKRTYVVRLTFPMPEGVAMSNMTGEARIFGDPKANALAIPRDALIRTEHGDRVVLALGEGRFKPVEVKPGIESGDKVEIVSGLRAGDRVVVSAQFLIDSESSLRAEFLRMGGPSEATTQGGKPAPVHDEPDSQQHGDHAMK